MCPAGARGPAADFLPTWKAGFLRWAGAAPCPPGAAAQVPPPGKEQGKATWAADTMSSLKPPWSWMGAGERIATASPCLPFTSLCVKLCVCVRVFVSMEKDRNTGEDLPL